MDTGDTAWVLASAALVLLMTPGLALFYGGMVRAKSVLNMMMMSFGALAVVGVLWVLWGYSIAFGDDLVGGLVGDPLQFAGLNGLIGVHDGTTPGHAAGEAEHLVGTVPAVVFAGFQGTFAMVTVALVSGAIADRARFGAWLVFAGLWMTLVYAPVAHWSFAFDGLVAEEGGWLAGLGVVDFAGGTVVEINSGAAGLALALVLGRRLGFGRDPMRPHNLPLVMLGAGLLWFGWFGFNAGSALGANGVAAVAWINTMVAGATAVFGWLLVERLRDGHATSLGAASGAVAGLVAVTPACSALNPVGAMVLGLVAGALCAAAIGLKHRFGYDDSLDVVGVHLVGGLWGTIAIGLLATADAPAGVDGLLFGGGFGQLGKQLLAAVAVLGYSFVVTLALGLLLEKTIGFRIHPDDELAGIDQVEHAETAYDLATTGAGARMPGSRPAGTTSPTRTPTHDTEVTP
ncbi:Amt family ammonium transporter [Kineococcus xinjiangensis]|uniref:Ammonium transporter n=1 Tax=Kineococcus xinjiangensis TaxID=512762 RepID=A0A2S6IW69_9ACTN|nr:ammonium transporter [Kineococcus xinjiangensis]PPK98535.1 Amt family ammonium transporter [Kineococcus xinjiangensis]